MASALNAKRQRQGRLAAPHQTRHAAAEHVVSMHAHEEQPQLLTKVRYVQIRKYEFSTAERTNPTPRAFSNPRELDTKQLMAASHGAASSASADDHALLRGHRFYVARDVAQARRRELHTLIQNNGGVVEQQFVPGAVELVESDRLKTGTAWVSVDFVYDSVRDQVLQDVHQYTAAAHAHDVAQQRNDRIGDNPKRQGKMLFTASDDAKMLQFIVNHFKGTRKWGESIPESAWATAAAKGVTAHSAASMHERYRKHLRKWTPEQRRNTIKHAQDEKNAHERKELSKKNATTSELPSAPAASAVATTSTDAAALPPPQSQSTAHEASGAKEPAAAPQHERTTDVKPALPQPNDEETEEESTQGRHKKKRKRVRKSAAEKKRSLEEARTPTGAEMAPAPLDSAASPDSRTSFIRPPPSKKMTPEKGQTHLRPATTAEVVIKSPPKAATPEKDRTAEQATLAESESIRNTLVAPLEVASPASTAQQNEQDMPHSPPSAQGKNVDCGAAESDKVEAAAITSPQVHEEARAEVAPAVEAVSPPTPSAASSERRIGGIFFRSRWAELINDPAQRKQLNTYCTLNRQQLPPSRVSQKNRQPAKPRATSEAAPAKGAAAASRGKKRRMGAVAGEDEESKERERQAKTRGTSSAAQKKRKVQSTEPQSIEAPSTPTNAAEEICERAPVQREVVDVCSDTAIDELIYQIQFETCQDLASVTHALYYCSGDVEVTTKFLSGELPSDVWSPEDDLLLVDFMDRATDLSRIAEAQRTGAFSKMRVRRSVEQILTRIQYLL